MPQHIGSLALRKGAARSSGDGFYTLNFDTGTSTKLVDPDPGKPRLRLNDGKVDRQGRFVAGYMDYEEREPLCSVFRLDINLPSRRSTAGSSARTARAGAPMAGPSISLALGCRRLRVEYVRLRRRARALPPRMAGWTARAGLPVGNATSVIFGGPNLDIAYVSSMARVVKGVRQCEREAGALFAVYGLGVRGIPEPRFRG